MLLYLLDLRGSRYATWFHKNTAWLEVPALYVSDGLRWIDRSVYVLSHSDALLRLQESKTFRRNIITKKDNPYRLPEMHAMPIRAIALGSSVHMEKILGHRVNPMHHYLWINSHNSPNQQTQAVFSAEGLLGHVSQRTKHRARVTLLDDVASKIPVYTQSKQYHGVLMGRGSGRMLSLAYVPINAQVKKGDPLFTSGLGGVYPAGYPVAEVIWVRRDVRKPFLSIKARSYASAYRHFYVFFLTPARFKKPKSSFNNTVSSIR